MKSELARQVGNTYSIIHGAKSTGAIVVCGTQRHADDIKRQYGVEAVSVETELRGLRKPIVFDHFAVFAIESKYESELSLLRSKVERQTKLLDDIRYCFKNIWALDREKFQKEFMPRIDEALSDVGSEGEKA